MSPGMGTGPKETSGVLQPHTAEGKLRLGAAFQGQGTLPGTLFPAGAGFKGLHKQRRALNSSSSRGGQENLPSRSPQPGNILGSPLIGPGEQEFGMRFGKGPFLPWVRSRTGIDPDCSKTGPGSEIPTFSSSPSRASQASIPGISPWDAQQGQDGGNGEFWELLLSQRCPGTGRRGRSPPGIPALAGSPSLAPTGAAQQCHQGEVTAGDSPGGSGRVGKCSPDVRSLLFPAREGILGGAEPGPAQGWFP